MVHFRQRLGIDNVNKMNEKIVELKTHMEALPTKDEAMNSSDENSDNNFDEPAPIKVDLSSNSSQTLSEYRSEEK